MKKVFAVFMMTIVGLQVFSQQTEAEIKGVISFSVKNFGLSTKGTLGQLTGDITFDPNDLESSNFVVSIKANTINTNNKARDKHLRSADYFDVESYPDISFKSNQISGQPGSYEANGELTIKNKTQRVTIPFTFEEINGNKTYNGTLAINRLDYGVGKSSWTLSDDVKIKIKVIVN